MAKLSADKEKQIVKECQERLQKAIDEDGENRQMALDDLKFIAVDGAQWPDDVKKMRTDEGRPCLTINKMPVFIDQVIGDQRMNRPMIKVIPVDSKGDKEIARILGGWIKHVQQISKSDVAVDHGFEHAVACGYGAMRVVTRFTSDSAFEQEAYIEKVDNALAVYWGKHIEYDCSDAMYCIIISDVDNEEYKARYKEDPIPFNKGDSQYVEGWCTKDTMRVAEYFVKEPVKKTLYLLEDNRVVDKLKDGETPVRERTVNSYKIMWYLVSGNKVLEYREWPGKKYIPVVPIWGKELNVGGKRYIRGLIRNAKDAQRMYNYWQSTDTETVTLQPKSPYVLTPTQIKGHEVMWNNAHKKNYPYLLANGDKDAPGWPHREAPPQVSSAMVEKLKESDQEMRDTVGLQKAALGMQSNERSGAAIRERKKEGDIGTFAFVDNLSRSLEHVGRILVDIAPSVLDTERIVRLGLENGDYEFSKVNVQAPDGSIINDLSIGTYDIVVTVGPSFTTQRTEAMESMKEFIQYYPQAAPIIGDLYAKAADWPGADELSQRLEFLLPPEIRQKIAADKAAKSGEPSPPPEDSSGESQSDPELEIKIQEGQMRIQEMQIKLEQEKVKLEGLKIKNEMMQKEGTEDTHEGDTATDEGTVVQARADGGPVKGGQPYLVGEKGPEVVVPKQDGQVIPSYGLRTDGSPKGKGWMGELKMKDGSGRVATELSIGVGIDGKEQLIPSLVPTLDKDELDHLLKGGEVTEQIVHKAIQHAMPLIRSGKSPFYSEADHLESDKRLDEFEGAQE